MAIRALKKAGDLDKNSALAGQISTMGWRPIRRVEAADKPDTRLQDVAHGVRDEGRLRGHAHDPKRAMPHARTGVNGRRAFCEPALPSRRLMNAAGQDNLSGGAVNATEPII